MTVALRRKTVAEDVRRILKLYNGAYFDAQDLSTMFQDAAGTVPVTAMEQPVGKWLDKSGKGNHATQSVTASRPVISARYNLLTKTEDFSDAVWVKTAMALSYSPIQTPFGFKTVTKLSPTNVNSGHTISQAIPYYIANNAFSFVIKSAGANFASILLRNSADARYDRVTFNLLTGLEAYRQTSSGALTAACMPLGDGWFLIKGYPNYESSYRVGISTVDPSAPDATYDGSFYTGDGTSGIYVLMPQLEYGPTTTTYQRVNTATDYDTVGFKKYLKFDGVDDYLNLPYMGLYANGSASIVAARNALSQATDTYVISERSTSNVNPKYFPSRQLANAGNMDAYIVNDAGGVVVDTVGSTYGGASNAVIRSVVDSGNNIKLFKNGALAANDNYTRSGTLTLTNTTIGASVSTTTSNYANMKLYGLAITKSALSDSERRRVERLLAYNSGVQI